MRTLTKIEFVDHYLEYELGLYGLTMEEHEIYYRMYIFGRKSVKA